MSPHIEQLSKYPSTRYMGSKSKLLDAIWEVSTEFEFDTVLDLFSGSGIVSYLYKCHGKEVTSNDYMAMAATYAKALIENQNTLLSYQDVSRILRNTENDSFVETVFKDLYFTDEENRLIDNIRANIKRMRNPYKKAIAMAALIRACTKKRPRGIFTYTGQRYNDGRQDLRKSMEDQFREAVTVINGAIFDNGRQNRALWSDSLNLKKQHYCVLFAGH